MNLALATHFNLFNAMFKRKDQRSWLCVAAATLRSVASQLQRSIYLGRFELQGGRADHESG